MSDLPQMPTIEVPQPAEAVRVTLDAPLSVEGLTIPAGTSVETQISFTQAVHWTGSEYLFRVMCGDKQMLVRLASAEKGLLPKQWEAVLPPDTSPVLNVPAAS